jgi:hypothetical protein
MFSILNSWDDPLALYSNSLFLGYDKRFVLKELCFLSPTKFANPLGPLHLLEEIE